MNRATRRNSRRSSGFSLVEMMIAIAIALFLSAVLTGVYLGTSGSFRYQDAMSRVQENARFAMERLARDIRMAGYTGCGALSRVANTVVGATASPWLNLETPVVGYEGDTSTFPAQFADRVAGSDAIIVLGVASSPEISVISHNAPAATIHTTEHPIKPGTILMVTDCSQTSIFQMSGPTNNNNNAININHNTGNDVNPGNCTKDLGASCGETPKPYTFKAGASVMQMYASGYFIAPSQVGGVNVGNSLWVCPITSQSGAACLELINGVEDMQIEYGVDSDGDSSANTYAKANSVADWSTVVSVRVSLLLATPIGLSLSSKPQTYDYDDTTVTAGDRRVRHVYSSVINLRNRTK